MASIRRETQVAASPVQVWEVVRDIGAIHQRLVPGFVTDCKLEGDARIVTFGNGVVAREVIVDMDDAARRLVWSASGGRSLACSCGLSGTRADGALSASRVCRTAKNVNTTAIAAAAPPT